jgi:uncharacterized cupin superfamily protein
MPKINLDAIPPTNATSYPLVYAEQIRDRWYRRLGTVTGITDFGFSHATLKPGAWSSQRHWHEGEDEIVIMIAGEAVLIDDSGETVVRAGDVLAFPKNDGNGHCLINRSDRDCVFLAVAGPSETDCHYPDIDMHLDAKTNTQCHKDGTPWAK